MRLLVLSVTFAALAVCVQTCKAHLITLLLSLEEQQTFELILNCSCSLCKQLQSDVMVILVTCTFFIPLFFAFVLLISSRMLRCTWGMAAGWGAEGGCRRGMRLFLCAGAAPAASLLMRPGTGERHDGEESCFEEPALKMKPFEGCPR